jgi:excisionase family DNA binding protein
LYVGVSLSAIQRLAQHRDASHWFAEIASVKVERFADRKEALAAERAAITAENPRHNLYRPSGKEVAAARAEESRQDLVRRLVQFNPTYSRGEAGQALGVSEGTITKWINDGTLGHIRLGSRFRITGWHLIDFIEARTACPIEPPTDCQRSEPRSVSVARPSIAGSKKANFPSRNYVADPL